MSLCSWCWLSTLVLLCSGKTAYTLPARRGAGHVLRGGGTYHIARNAEGKDGDRRAGSSAAAWLGQRQGDEDTHEQAADRTELGGCGGREREGNESDHGQRAGQCSAVVVRSPVHTQLSGRPQASAGSGVARPAQRRRPDEASEASHDSQGGFVLHWLCPNSRRPSWTAIERERDAHHHPACTPRPTGVSPQGPQGPVPYTHTHTHIRTYIHTITYITTVPRLAAAPLAPKHRYARGDVISSRPATFWSTNTP